MTAPIPSLSFASRFSSAFSKVGPFVALFLADANVGWLVSAFDDRGPDGLGFAVASLLRLWCWMTAGVLASRAV
jgi:hypothetical protein